MKKAIPFLILTWLSLPTSAYAQTIDVKHYGTVDLTSYDCTATVSSFVHQVCFDERDGTVVVQLRDTFYAYCDVPAAAVSAWLTANSKGSFYNQNIKGNFGC
ncbi:KTSC domain-containing protein [Devosia sp. WQ 349]|uniref:KTSC domain-containing protein n=1 Tax=Devosia sp. WQ 349K1 TaxID=2800329 RepID=UPI00190710E8|nr:KTSC domain-containing protein [Devosia sp. WQ 349K1]MBK1793533.1 KTSC domain-containing protein [Devosia sp. WQ 349K1]